jgi:hypothetical protein
MEVNTNFSARGVDGITPRQPAASAAKSAATPDAFANSTALAQAVKNLPASRPEAVAQATELAADPNYPSSAVLRQVATLLAGSLVSGLE